MFKRLSLVLLLALSCAAGQAFGQQQAETAPIGPRLEIDIKEIDLGPINKGDDAEARFALRNTGDQPLEILNAKPG